MLLKNVKSALRLFLIRGIINERGFNIDNNNNNNNIFCFRTFR
jgi:hypothetical protein